MDIPLDNPPITLPGDNCLAFTATNWAFVMRSSGLSSKNAITWFFCSGAGPESVI